MKIRNGFVSNSSSSSFVCDKCERREVGFDITLDDCGMYECEKEHTLCKSCLIKDPNEWSMEKKFQYLFDKNIIISHGMDINDEFYEYIHDHGMPIETCPICMFENITKFESLQFIFKKYNINYQKIDEEIKKRFKSYKEFTDYLNEK